MKIIDWSEFIENKLPLDWKFTSMTIGVFDGVHLGHQALIKQIVSFNTNYIPVIVTFRQNHKIMNNVECGMWNENMVNLQTFEQRLEMFEKLGIQITIVIDFTDEFKKMPGINFLKVLLEHGNIGFFAVGCNFKCGNQLDTDAETIQRFFTSHNVPAEIVPQVLYPEDGSENTLPISSSRIRRAIAAGNNSLAKVMLGWRF